MYNAIRKIKEKKKLKNFKKGNTFFNIAVLMFISFSILNIFLIFNFINILNNMITI